MITSTVIVPAAGVCEMLLAFYQDARHRSLKDFESLFIWNYPYLAKDTQELPVFINDD
jgi:hypothetical protein